jgi:5-methylcytosine-specific restriction enzyme subunit McrC
MKIPILNIYYLLCYAWNQLEESEIVDVKAEDTTTLLDLLARVLVSGTNHILKRGLDRGYISYSDAIRGIKGKINFNTTLKKQLLCNARVQCEFDELSHNVLHNQIIKSTIKGIVTKKDITINLRNELLSAYRVLNEIEEIQLNANIFSRVQLHRNNSFYSFLINICEMIYSMYLISEDPGESKFRDFLRDRASMARLFEEFVRNFYRRELPAVAPGYKVVGSEIIKWDVVEADDESMGFLPSMKTDISIKTPEKYIIIDTKYYENALQKHYKETVHSANLYQLFAYVKNIEQRGEYYKDCEGILLYPTVGTNLNLQYEVQGHKVCVRTINLANDWRDIHVNLMEILGVETSQEQVMSV